MLTFIFQVDFFSKFQISNKIFNNDGIFPYSLVPYKIAIDILGRLDDPCASVRIVAIECLSRIDVDRNDSNYSEASCSDLAEAVISRLFLYFDDPFIKLRPILLGDYIIQDIIT